MNTRQAIQPSTTSHVLSLSYSASGKRFVAGMSDGMRMFRTDNCLTTRQPDLPFDCGISVAEALDDRYCAFVCNRRVRDGSPNVVVFWDAVLERELSRFDFYEPVLGIRLTSRWMAVILEQRVVLFQYQELQNQKESTSTLDQSDYGEVNQETRLESLRAPNLVHSIYQTCFNPFALGALSNDMLLLPAQSAGQVQVISLNANGSSTKRVLPAHESSLRCLAMSRDASLLATASERGTLIRVFNTRTLDRIVEHRRGVDPAIIQGLAFSPGNRWIASTSDKGTLHVFDLRPPGSSDTAGSSRERDMGERSHRKSTSYAKHRLSGTSFDKDSVSGMSAGRYSASPSTAAGTGAGTAAYHGSVQEYYGLRPPPSTAAPPAREAAVSAMAALKASPFAPRILKDTRSIASAPFYIGNDPPHWQGGLAYSSTFAPNGTKIRVKNPVLPLPNDPKGRPPKGIVTFAPASPGETDDEGAVLYVIGGGKDARWEMFQLMPAASFEGATTGGWAITNRGFRRYLTRQFVD